MGGFSDSLVAKAASTPDFSSALVPKAPSPFSGLTLPHSWDEVWAKLKNMSNVRSPRPIGGGEEAMLAEGAPVGAQGMAMLGTVGMGVEALAARSLAPLYPLARGILGAWAGKHIGREAGGLVGQPEIGEKVGEIGLGMYAAGGGKIPTKGDVMEFFNKPEFQETGAPLPSVEEFYANHGKEIMQAMKQQPAAFGIPEPPSGAPLPSVAEFYEKRGREIMAAIKQQPEAFGFSRGGGLKPPAEAESSLSGSPQDLISRTKKLVQPGEQPSAEDLKRAGDLTQAPFAKLKLLANWGDKLAENEINRRLRNQ